MASISDLYYDAGSPAAFWNLPKIRAAEFAERNEGKPRSIGSVKAGLEEQVACTLHRPVRKSFARNPYTVSNVRDVLECDSQNTMIITHTFYLP